MGGERCVCSCFYHTDPLVPQGHVGDLDLRGDFVSLLEVRDDNPHFPPLDRVSISVPGSYLGMMPAGA